MSISKENLGKLAFIMGKKAHATNNYDAAADFFADAARNYSDAGTQVENLRLAYLNQGGALIGANKAIEAIVALEKAKDAGVASEELTKNFAAAYCNLGLQQKAENNWHDALASFTKAKTYAGDDANISYDLGLAMLSNKDFVSAATVFTELLSKAIPADKFPLELRLNSYCKLIECLSKQNLIIDENTLKSAAEVFAGLDPAEHEKHALEADFIYSRLVMLYLDKCQNINALAALNEVESLIPGKALKIAKDLEQFAMYKSKTGEVKSAMDILLTLAKTLALYKEPGTAVEEVIEVAELAKKDLGVISDILGKGEKFDDFTIKALSGICTYDDIEALLV